MRAEPSTHTSTRSSRLSSPARLAAALLVAASGCAAGPRSPAAPWPASDEVPVGYGTQSRRELTSAVGSVTACDAHGGMQAVRVEEMLQGRVAGVDVGRRPDGRLSVRIRGPQSLVGESEPLFVVDGLPLSEGSADNALAGISPQDVKRIDVLKDAGATAIYGSRGMHGVVLITTKRGEREC